jgi:LCP family protein required for cell wall assembly
VSLTCTETRRLIDSGLQPGSATRQRAELGFHLSHCAQCRSYRRQASEQLLVSLLAEVPPPAPRPPPPRRWRWLRYSLVVILALLAGWLGTLAGRMVYAAYTIQQNVAAMQLDPTPALSVPLETVQLPLPTLAASPTPRRQALVAGALRGDESVAVAATSTALPASPSPVSASATVVAIQPSATTTYQLSPTPIRLPTLMPTLGGVPPSDSAVTILLLGSDRRPGEGWTTRSDAIVVVRLDPVQQRIAMLSLPRDLIVAIPGYGQARINAATVYGDLYPELGGGVSLARETVSQLLDLPIDYVLRADFSAFTSAVDAIGGIDIEVEQALYDAAYPTMYYGYQEVYIPAGMQRMDGATALIYSRIRHSDSAYARNRRQQQVLLAILRRVRDQNLLGQAEMIADVTGALRNDIQTDMSIDQMIGLGLAYRSVSPDAVERYALDETMVSEGVIPGDPYATFALPGTIETLSRKLVYGPDA